VKQGRVKGGGENRLLFSLDGPATCMESEEDRPYCRMICRGKRVFGRFKASTASRL
jgi:hypothetical protein